MEKQPDYKKTLAMPQTEFSMRANLVKKEADYQKRWKEIRLYQKILAQNGNLPFFLLHDGPPYANGKLHLGHALNKILKDFIIRYKNMSGFQAPFVAGWDTHGLPIEHKMLTKAHLKHTDLDALQLRNLARNYAWSQVRLQKKQFQSLQLLADFETIYLTMDKDFEAEQLKLFKQMFFQGLVYKGLKPIYWSPSSQSALAEAEVIYQDKESPSIYLALKMASKNEDFNEQDYLVIWTTTPWTLVANSGVAINKDFLYAKVNYQKRNFIIAHDLVAAVAKKCHWQNYQIVKTFKADILAKLEYWRPLQAKKGLIVLSQHVSLETGSGLVHLAPLFGEDDFLVAQKQKLEMIMHISDDGTINKEGGPYHKLFYEKANQQIIADLKKQELLLSYETIKHSYPHDWRTKQPIMYRATPQWFISIDKIKNQIFQALKKVAGNPSWVIQRLKEMIAQRQAWTISRQRIWGVPIPIFYDQQGQILKDPEQFDFIIELVKKEGSDIWFSKSTDELLLEKYRQQNFSKETSIMDVWFDSGSTNVALKIANQSAPFDLYLEGSDQFRGWFNSSLINSVVYRQAAPYKFLLAHGFVLDGNNEKMSKSKGNVFAPEKITQKLGADILRLWVASVEYQADVKISEEIVQRVSDNYRKIRNTIRFILGNLKTYQFQNNLKLVGIHLYAYEKIANLRWQIKKAYEKYRFYNVTKAISNLLVDFSNYYFNYGKDLLYVEALKNPQRLMLLNNLHFLLETVLIGLAPILPTTTEEAYQYFYKSDKKVSLHLERFWKTSALKDEQELKWKAFFAFKNEIYREMEKLVAQKIIKRSHEAKITYNQDLPEWLEKENLAQLLMVAEVKKGPKFEISAFQGAKCPRCWNLFKSSQKNSLCYRCQALKDKGAW